VRRRIAAHVGPVRLIDNGPAVPVPAAAPTARAERPERHLERIG
jgi:hypothetical protein